MAVGSLAFEKLGWVCLVTTLPDLQQCQAFNLSSAKPVQRAKRRQVLVPTNGLGIQFIDSILRHVRQVWTCLGQSNQEVSG